MPAVCDGGLCVGCAVSELLNNWLVEVPSGGRDLLSLPLADGFVCLGGVGGLASELLDTSFVEVPSGRRDLLSFPSGGREVLSNETWPIRRSLGCQSPALPF